MEAGDDDDRGITQVETIVITAQMISTAKEEEEEAHGQKEAEWDASVVLVSLFLTFVYYKILTLSLTLASFSGRRAKKFVNQKGVVKGGIRKRKYPRDLYCVVIFAIFWVVLLGIAILAFATGNVRTYNSIPDFQKKMPCLYLSVHLHNDTP